MTDRRRDEILELSLKALEDGADLEDVLRDLPSGYRDIDSLDRLAEASRALSHPRMSITRAQYRLKSIIQITSRYLGSHIWIQHKAIPVALSLGLVTIVVMVLLLFNRSGSFLTSTTAVLQNSSGVIEISDVQDPQKWSFAADGDRVREGTRIRTYIDSSVTLVYPDGSFTVLAPDSEITLVELSGKSGFIQARFEQHHGTSNNQVVRFSNNASFFIVDTQAGTISVHGTRFTVAVSSNGRTRVAVNSGEVIFARQGVEIRISPGKALLADPQVSLDYPLYEFSLQGDIRSITGDIWNVAGVSFFTGKRTEIGMQMQVGDQVLVQGRILETGERLADTIKIVQDAQASSGFSGKVEAISGDRLVIDGREVIIDAQTEMDTEIKVGDVVVVTFLASSEQGWRALQVMTAGQTPADLVAGILPESLPSSTPTSIPLIPLAVATPTSAGTVCEGGKLHPDGLILAAKYEVPYDTIIERFCQGFGFGEIDLAYEISGKSQKPVDDLFSLRTSGLGWGVIRKEFLSVMTAMPEPSLDFTPVESHKPTREPKATKEPKPTRESRSTPGTLPTLAPKPTSASDLDREP